MVDLAEKSLDVQYYIWERDTSGRLLAERLVRVRVLIDDINIKRPDSALAAFDAHPNIEVRSFNPLVTSSGFGPRMRVNSVPFMFSRIEEYTTR